MANEEYKKEFVRQFRSTASRLTPFQCNILEDNESNDKTCSLNLTQELLLCRDMNWRRSFELRVKTRTQEGVCETVPLCVMHQLRPKAIFWKLTQVMIAPVAKHELETKF